MVIDILLVTYFTFYGIYDLIFHHFYIDIIFHLLIGFRYFFLILNQYHFKLFLKYQINIKVILYHILWSRQYHTSYVFISIITIPYVQFYIIFPTIPLYYLVSFPIITHCTGLNYDWIYVTTLYLSSCII